MGDTTNIFELPSDPVGGSGGSGNNISFSTQESGNATVDQTTINQIVNGLQQASHAGMTQLRSRDVPMNTEGHTNDPQVQPNYIPQMEEKQHEDYVRDDDECDLMGFHENRKTSDGLDKMYNELHMPLLISVLFFCFQLPIFKRMLYKYIPFLVSDMGVVNIYGYLFTSFLFGLVCYIASKIIVK